ncbi:hypothetical protein [Pectobacterium wasabiae]|uniref:DUF1883 domain-containing protein n=1 Tax=Pectobacterium wasabiae TaxID=55208 RepID=A0AAW3EMB7_9GAMM|nr:hypothetical protein [Pectobacterium wasabiae]AOR65166.1 hypothetical protein A7983_18270 [Pectobacterium wasabiae CFBP 3304]EJS95975.1 Hypothetical protein Y17_0951 [Pectobacterium wasabiae CFBP 3304]KFX09574.1 hypothetical protein JV38_01185 [Pectobacterium wasabiae]KGA29776.1 hypothetical protein KU73_04910 [Pectobacterium wasabiae]
MSVIRTCLSLFGGDTVIVRCANTFEVKMSNGEQETMAEENSDMQGSICRYAEGEVYLTVPYTGVWDVVIRAKNDTPEHSITYFPA